MPVWMRFPRFAFVLILFALLAFPSRANDVAAAPNAAPATSIVISEFRTRGPNGVNDEFVELFNPINAAIDISGWELWASNASGTTSRKVIISASTILQPGQHYLIAHSGYGGSVAKDATYSTAMTDDGGIALTKSGGLDIVDQVGMSNGSAYKEGNVLPQLAGNSDQSYERNPSGANVNCWDANDNVSDFIRIVPSAPQNMLSPLVVSCVPAADIMITQSAPLVINYQTNANLVITATNQGADYATNIQVRDQLPNGLTFVSFSATHGSYDPLSGIWTIGNLNNLESAELTITVKATDFGIKINKADIWASDQIDSNLSNNNSSASVTVQFSNALTITNTVNNPNPLVGTNVIFTIDVSNAGNLLDATNVQVAALLPSGLDFISYSATNGAYDSVGGIWTIGNLALNASQRLTITAKVAQAAPGAYRATVTSLEYSPSFAEQTFTPTPLAGAAELALSQTFAVRNDAPARVDLTLSLKNNGLDTATNIQVRDLLPSGLAYIVHAQTRGSYNPTNGIWTINALAASDEATLTLTAKVAASGTSTKNTAQIIASDQYDVDANNNLTALEIPIADISLTQRLDQTPTTAIFTVTAMNVGPDAATLEIKSNLPSLASYAFISAGASSGTYDPVNGLWQLTLPSGTDASLTLTTNLVGALQSHIVEVVSSSAPDPDSIANNRVPAEDDMSGLPFADLALTQTVSKANPNVGETIMLTIKIKNDGASGTNGVQIKSVLPNGLTYSSSSATKGSYNPSNGVWTIGGLAKNETATLTLSAKVSFSGAFSVQSEIFASNFYDPDSIPNNGKDGEDDMSIARIITPSAARSVIINEVAWAGTTSALSADEWIELYNTTDSAINLNGWTLKAADGTPSIALNGVILARGFFLLEQGDDNVVSDIAADQIYSGSLSNSGETLYLRDGANALIDSANGNGGGWPAGSASTYGTMERRGVSAESDLVWHTNNGIAKNGKNANGGEIWGTPKRANSASLLPTQTPYTGPTTIPTLPIPPRPIFNEILARPGFDWNQDGAINAFDEFVEIKNLTAIEISLKNWKIATLKGGTFILPDIKLAPNERRVFYGKETNLRLSDGGETLILVSPQGKIYDTFAYSFARTENQSFCRLPDGSPTDKAWYEDCLPTPNLSNMREGKAPPTSALNACNLPDTIPFAFFLAECRAYGDGIWNPRYWQQAFARRLTDENSKWDLQIE